MTVPFLMNGYAPRSVRMFELEMIALGGHMPPAVIFQHLNKFTAVAFHSDLLLCLTIHNRGIGDKSISPIPRPDTPGRTQLRRAQVHYGEMRRARADAV